MRFGKKFTLELQSGVLWLYIGNNIHRSISWGYGKYWEKPQLGFRTNGARKYIKEDTCFDCTLTIWRFWFSYTNWMYNKR